LPVSERRACAALGQHRSTQRKVPRGRENAERLTADVIELARCYGRYGYRKIAALLRQAGWSVSDGRVERIWKREGLKVPHKAILRAWDTNPGVLPQVATSSREALRVCLATFHRMTYAPQAALSSVGRELHWLDRVFEQPGSGALLSMAAAICELYATGQDDHADAHRGVVMEWLKPADGRIYDRVLQAENSPVSTSTHPRLDNKELVPRVDALGKAERAGNVSAAKPTSQRNRTNPAR